jgi:hypothetical protein
MRRPTMRLNKAELPTFGRATTAIMPGIGGQIYVLANLRRAVRHAGLPAHEQCPNAIAPESRKDFPARGRETANPDR